MKKTFFYLCLFGLISAPLTAGEFVATGMKLGFNQSKFVGSDTPGKGVSNLPGFAIGGFAVYNVNPRWSLQQELLLLSRGSQINTIGEMNLHTLFLYVDLPLQVKFTVLPESTIKPFVSAGPELGLKVLAINEVGQPDDIRTLDIGLTFGGGVSYARISAELRYYRGLSNFDQSADDISLKNQTFSILFGYAF